MVADNDLEKGKELERERLREDIGIERGWDKHIKDIDIGVGLDWDDVYKGKLCEVIGALVCESYISWDKDIWECDDDFHKAIELGVGAVDDAIGLEEEKKWSPVTCDSWKNYSQRNGLFWIK